MHRVTQIDEALKVMQSLPELLRPSPTFCTFVMYNCSQVSLGTLIQGPIVIHPPLCYVGHPRKQFLQGEYNMESMRRRHRHERVHRREEQSRI